MLIVFKLYRSCMFLGELEDDGMILNVWLFLLKLRCKYYFDEVEVRVMI